MKVVLINPPVRHGRYKSRQASIPPAGLGYLAAYLEEQGVHCNVIDGKMDELTIEEVGKEIEKVEPDIVGLSAMTPDIVSAVEIARNVKEILPGVSTVMGGPHAIAIPRETLEEFTEIDFVVTGEGEETLAELVRSIEKGGNFHEIKGLGFREDSKVVINPFRDYMTEIDKLPFPAWDKFKGKSPTYFVLSSRGCPYRCSFCMQSSGRVVRERSPENVVEEIEWLVREQSPGKVIFIDETFTLKKERVLEITDLILKKGLNRKIEWVAQTRVDRIDAEVLTAMKKAGCEKIEIGVESGNQEILNTVDKSIKLSQVEDTVRMARKTGLMIACTFILGHPYETEETIKDTIDFAVKLRPDSVSFGIMSPYPGTRIWKMAKAGEGNYILLSRDWEEFMRFGGGCLELTNLPIQRLEMLQIKAYFLFYLRTLKIIGFIQYGFPRLRQSKAVVKKLLTSKNNASRKSL